MFGLFGTKNPYEQPARQLYASAFNHTRMPCFYQEYAVPDTLDGRFDLLLLHLFLIINRMQGEGRKGAQLGQAMFDVAFADVDQGLRENGIGDMGLPKHMRRMMLAFNGRMHSYAEAVESSELDKTLARNLYGTLENPRADVLSRMSAYVTETMAWLGKQQSERIFEGQIEFIEPQEAKKYGT
ncbi:MAG: hypothetical protein DHS20C02_07210 [Micavibrio sp.]|nr:MAG: hypothetical protein DHS20C02_07210 [Micavibrio sp.]